MFRVWRGGSKKYPINGGDLMLKWLHIGMVALLLAIAAASLAIHLFGISLLIPEPCATETPQGELFCNLKRQGVPHECTQETRHIGIACRSGRFVLFHFCLDANCKQDIKRYARFPFISIGSFESGDASVNGVALYHFLYEDITISLIPIAILACAYPALCFVRWTVRKRRRRQLPTGCPRCNYDLTGNESGTCPECGLAIELPA